MYGYMYCECLNMIDMGGSAKCQMEILIDVHVNQGFP